MAEPRYFYSVDGTDVQGPLELGELQQLFAQGAVNSDTQLCPEGSEDWHPINLAFFPNQGGAAVEEAPPPVPEAAKRAAVKAGYPPEKKVTNRISAEKPVEKKVIEKKVVEKKVPREEPVRAPEDGDEPAGLFGKRNIMIAGVVAGVLVLGAVGYAIKGHFQHTEEAPAPETTATSTPAPSQPTATSANQADTASAAAAVQKIKDVSFSSPADDGMSQVQKVSDKVGSGTAAADKMARDLLDVDKQYFQKVKAVSDAVRQCDFNIMSLNGADDISSRQQEIGAVRDAQNAVVGFLQNIDSTAKAALSKDGFNDADSAAGAEAYHKSVPVDALVSLWQAQAKLSSDHIARFEFMKKNVAGWSNKDGKLLFAKQDLVDQYNSFTDMLRADVKQIGDLQKQVAAGPAT